MSFVFKLKLSLQEDFFVFYCYYCVSLSVMISREENNNLYFSLFKPSAMLVPRTVIKLFVLEMSESACKANSHYTVAMLLPT